MSVKIAINGYGRIGRNVLRALFEGGRTGEFDVVAINLDQDRELANQFLKQTPANFTLAFDPSGSTAESYSVQVMPSSYLIDRNGELVAVHKGFRKVDTATLEKEIRQLLSRR